MYNREIYNKSNARYRFCGFRLSCKAKFNKDVLNNIIREILNRKDLFESKKREFEKI